MRLRGCRLPVATALAMVLFVPTAPVATAAATTPRSDGVLSGLVAEQDSGRVVIAVKVRRGADNTAVAAVAAVAGAARAQGGRRRQTLRQLDTVTVEVPPARVEAFTERIRRRADVARVELVPRRSLSLAPNDPRYTAQASYLNAVSAPAAWSVGRSRPGLKIAVVDSGVDVNHPDLRGRVVGRYNAVSFGTDVTDTMGHGTFVAGVAAATGNNGVGMTGASMGASILAVKVSNAAGEIWADAVANGIIWAVNHGAKIINLSLGSATSGQAERDAVAYATRKGVLVVAAAGNNASSTRSYPAAYPKVVAVGATHVATKGRAWFSQYGSWVTVAAPGVSITGTTPTAGSSLFGGTSGYSVSDGTSFSAPIVAAEAAMLWSRSPSLPAADIRQAIVTSSHGYANLGLGAGQVDFRAAFDRLRPGSVPTLTGPTGGATVKGVVRVSARSTAPKVRFLINGAPLGAAVATKGGAASLARPSWGRANGPLTVMAVDCSIYGLCSARGAQVRVTLANAAPAVTSPSASQIVSGTTTFTATAPGGGVAFIVDGVRRGFDAAAPYGTYPISSLRDGTHSIRALSCSATGAACAGPASPPVAFTSRSLFPRITLVSPSVFSPNGDGRHDTTKLTYSLPDTEYVRFQVRDAAGTIVRDFGLGTLSAGTRTLTWNGLLNSGARAANGTYTLELATSGTRAGQTLFGSAVAAVRVDSTVPTLTAVSGSGTTFYPYPDSYRDSFTAKFSLNEPASATLTVRTGVGALVRSLTASRVAGATSILWNGKNTAGSRLAAGAYYWTLTATDVAGNRRTSPRYRVVVSGRRMVTKRITLSQRGASYYSVAGSGASVPCAWASKPQSHFAPYGVRLANRCGTSRGPLAAASTHRYTLPAARSYTSLRLLTYGGSMATSTLGAALTRWTTGSHTFTPEITVGKTKAWRTIGTVAATGLYNRSRQVETTLFVPNDKRFSDYDVKFVVLVVTYKALV